MQPDYKYRTYRPRSTQRNRTRQTSFTLPEFELPSLNITPLSEEAQLKQRLKSQEENLAERLAAVGVNPNNLSESDIDNRNFVERALNLTPDQGLLMDVIEVIDRPLQGVKGFIAGAVTGEGAFEEALEGIRGIEERTSVDFLDEIGFVDEDNLSGVSKFAVNLIGDMALDPLTYFAPLKFVAKKTGLIGSKVTKVLDLEQTIDVTKQMGVQKVRSVIKSQGPDFLKSGKYVDDTIEIMDVKTFEDTLQKRELQDLEILKKKGKLKPGGQAEKDFAEGIGSTFENAAEKLNADIKILKGDPSSVNPDVFLYQKVNVDGSDYWVLIDDIEVKGLTPTGKVPGVQPTLQIRQADDGSIEALFGSTSDFAKEYDSEIQTRMLDFVNKRGFVQKKGETVLQAFKRLQKSAKKKANLRDSFAKRVSKETFVDEDVVRRYLSENISSDTVRRELADRPALAETIAKAKTDYRAAKSKLGNVTATLDLDDAESGIKELFQDILLADENMRSNPFVGFVDPKSKEIRMAKISDLLDKIDFTESGISIERGKALRIKMYYGKGLSVSDIPDQTDEMLEFLMQEKILGTADEVAKAGAEGAQQAVVTYKTEGKILQFLNAKALDEKSIWQVPSKFALNVRDNVRKLFNVNADFSVEFQNQIGRIEGKQAQRLYEYQTKMNSIRDRLLKVDPEAGSRLSRIIERGAKIGDNGLIEYTERTVNAKRFFKNVVENLENGKLAIGKQFSSPVAEQSFLQQSNRILRNNALDNVELVAKKGPSGSVVFELTGDFDLDDVKAALGDNMLLDKNLETLSFGVKELDADDAKFLTNNRELVDEFKDLKGSIEDTLVGELGLQNLPLELQDKMSYLRHTLSDEAKEQLKDTAMATRSRYALEGSDPFAARAYDADIEEVNAAMRDFMDLEYDQLNDDAFDATINFIQDAMTVQKQDEMLKAILNNSIVQDQAGMRSFFKVIPNEQAAARELGNNYTLLNGSMSEEFSKMYKNLRPESQKVFDDFMKQMGYEGKEQAIAVHNSVYELLSRTNEAYIELPKLVKQYDSFLTRWKSITLVSPGFHLRNFFGNLSNMFTGGMRADQVGRYTAKGFNDIRLYKSLKERVVREGKDFMDDATRKIFDNVEDFYMNGVAQSRKGVRDLDKVKNLVLDGIDPNDPQYKQLYQRMVKANFELAENMDDIQRYAMYQWALEKGDMGDGLRQLKKQNASEKVIEQYRKAQARQQTMNALFDYDALTSFEKDYMKRLFPFYTFMKNNFVFQAKSLLSNPGKYARLGRAYDYWNEDIAGISTEDMPDYMQDNMWLPIPMTITEDDQDAIAFLKLNLPPSDFTELVENPFKKGVTSISAPAKLLIELGAGRDLFTGQQIQEFPGEAPRLAEGEGALTRFRDERGNLALTANPYIQKISNDLGLRVPRNYLSIALDIIDGIGGYQSFPETTADIFERFSLTGNQPVSNIELSKLYQDLEQLRNLRSVYEQQTGEDLPTLEELDSRFNFGN